MSQGVGTGKVPETNGASVKVDLISNIILHIGVLTYSIMCSIRSAKLTGCLALPERQSASAMVLTKLNPTSCSIKKEVLAESQNLHKMICPLR